MSCNPAGSCLVATPIMLPIGNINEKLISFPQPGLLSSHRASLEADTASHPACFHGTVTPQSSDAVGSREGSSAGATGWQHGVTRRAGTGQSSTVLSELGELPRAARWPGCPPARRSPGVTPHKDKKYIHKLEAKGAGGVPFLARMSVFMPFPEPEDGCTHAVGGAHAPMWVLPSHPRPLMRKHSDGNNEIGSHREPREWQGAQKY